MNPPSGGFVVFGLEEFISGGLVERFRPSSGRVTLSWQSNQTVCSWLGPFGVPSLRRHSIGPRRWAVPGPAALARHPCLAPRLRVACTRPCAQVALCGACDICVEDQDQDQKLLICFSCATVQTTPIATCAGRVEALRRGEKGHGWPVSRLGHGRPISGDPGVMPEGGNPEGAGTRSKRFGYFAKTK